MKLHINTEQDLAQLDRQIDSYDVGNHYPPYIICSEDTKQFLYKHKDRFSMIKDIEEYQGLDMYYICKIIVDNTLPFGEIEIR